MRWLLLFLLGTGLLVGGGAWILGSRADARAAVDGLCQATHAGEPWAHVQERAGPLGLAFVRANARTERVEEYLAWKDTLAERYGCRVAVEGGVVRWAKAGELPRE